MRLYSGQFNLIADEIIRTLRQAEMLEISAESEPEAKLDVVGVLREWVRMDRELDRKARELTPAGDGRSAELATKRRLAREKDFKLGEDAVEYIVAQIIEVLVQSSHVEEVYGEDRELRARVTPIMKRYAQGVEDQLDTQVRSRLKNLQEGSTAWDIEYEKAREAIRRARGLEE